MATILTKFIRIGLEEFEIHCKTKWGVFFLKQRSYNERLVRNHMWPSEWHQYQ